MNWKLIKGTPDYISGCGRFIAIYRDSYSGFGNYWVFRASTPKRERKACNVLSFGGLPSALVLARIEAS